jgi:outer membrane protein OmpA-like peptidoglycan-associated protein
MRARLWPVLLAVVALLAAQAATADPVGRYPYVTASGGFTTFDGDFHWPTGRPLTDKPYVGGRLGYQLGHLWAFELAGGVTPTVEDTIGGANVSFLHATANVVMSPWVTSAGGPYFFVGGGAGRLSTDQTASLSDAAAHLNQGLLEAGGGLRLWLTDAIGVKLEAREAHWLPKKSGSGQSVNYVTLSAGLTLAIGAKGRDTDGDGVPDSRDKCPDTPRGATVDAKGCPIDTDGDAVFDGLDKCPDTPKGCTVSKTGCQADEDGDFVCDGLDQCADTPKGATVDAKGCPSDTDGDGVLDGIDQCPNTLKGCTVDAKGCPSDADGDGVCDGVDQCADTPAGLKVDSVGCVIELVERETELMDTGKIRIQNIQFDTGKAILKPESFQSLDVVGTLLTQWPQLRIEVAGHTDNVGGAALNKKLSFLRAESVLSYMKGKYATIDSTRFTVKGYGKDKPLVPNVSDANKAQNRRVEFTVLNKEVLKKEVERRRLLKLGETAPADTTAKP